MFEKLEVIVGAVGAVPSAVATGLCTNMVTLGTASTVCWNVLE
jgi:hypothetical protein